MSSFIKIIFLLSVVNFLLMAVPALAAEPTPENNPMCWTKEACAAQFRANDWTTFVEEKNWESPGPGGVCKDMGVCIPAGKTSLEISLPTLKTTTADLGDYILAIYKYLVGIGGIVAAVLIIKGGFEWVTSGGSPERVKSAQATIGGALMGLLLLLGSYTLLYTINPDLVRLRLPGVYMIRKIVAGPTWCKDLPAGTRVAYSGGFQSSAVVPLEIFSIDPIRSVYGGGDPANTATCGSKYFWKDSNEKNCWGHLCAPSADNKSQVCVKGLKEDEFYCQEGNIFGRAESLAVGGWGDYPVNGAKLKALCSYEDKVRYILDINCAFDPTNNQKSSTDFILACPEWSLNPSTMSCPGGTISLFLDLELDDPNTLGGDDYYAIACKGDKPNLAELILPPETKEGDLEYDDFVAALLKDKAAFKNIKSELLSIDEVKAGTVCNINLDKVKTD